MTNLPALTCLAALAAGTPGPGPAVGAGLPALGLPDQTGRVRMLVDLAGENGLLLLVFRSADW